MATTYTDSAGNTGPSATTSNFEIDTKYPTVSSFTLSDTSLKAGETATVTLVFSEAVSGFSSSDDITVVNGSLSTMTSSDNITWSGTYTPSTDVEDTSNVLTLATTYIDSAGNAGPSATTSNFEIDTKYPTVSSFTLSDSALKVGETATVTLVFSEAVSGFSSSDDITVVNGSLTTMTSSDNITWTGTYTPSTDVEDTSNVLTLATTYTDSAGNAGPSVTTSNFEIDTKYPTVSSFTISDNALKAGETATVTLVFSEVVSGFSSSDDITVVNGSLTTMTSSDNITWTGTYTPSTDVEDTSNILTLATTYTDSAGNAGPSATTENYTMDTLVPTIISITPIWGSYLNAIEDNSDGIVTVVTTGVEDDQTLTIGLNSKNYTGTVNSNSVIITIAGADLRTLTEGTTYTITANVSDAAGNAATQGSTTFIYDITRPTLSEIGIYIHQDNSGSFITSAGKKVILTFKASESIQEPIVTFKSGSADITDTSSITYSTTDNITWTVSYITNSGDTNGIVSYSIEYKDLAGNNGNTYTSNDTILTIIASPNLITNIIITNPANDNTFGGYVVGDTITFTNDILASTGRNTELQFTLTAEDVSRSIQVLTRSDLRTRGANLGFKTGKYENLSTETNGFGSGAELTIDAKENIIDSITITNVGSGYAVGDTITVTANTLALASTGRTTDLVFTLTAEDVIIGEKILDVNNNDTTSLWKQWSIGEGQTSPSNKYRLVVPSGSSNWNTQTSLKLTEVRLNGYTPAALAASNDLVPLNRSSLNGFVVDESNTQVTFYSSITEYEPTNTGSQLYIYTHNDITSITYDSTDYDGVILSKKNTNFTTDTTIYPKKTPTDYGIYNNITKVNDDKYMYGFIFAAKNETTFENDEIRILITAPNGQNEIIKLPSFYMGLENKWIINEHDNGLFIENPDPDQPVG